MIIIMVTGKIVEEYGFWDNGPIILALEAIEDENDDDDDDDD